MLVKGLDKRWIDYNSGNYILVVLNYYEFAYFSLFNFSAVLSGLGISSPDQINSAQARVKLFIPLPLFLCKFVKSLM